MTSNQQADPLIGQLVDGRYRVRARIARGGMATVYVATDLRLERRVALKVMHGHLSDDSVFQSRFIQEARAAARLADPNVVNVYDQGQDGELAYLVMEYLPGITLRELLREQRRLTLEQAVTIMDAVLSGLVAAHKAGIVHRDVKPENVLLAEDGRIKIGDFGLARASTANTATGQQLLGTIAYLAPELVTRGTADARSDIYALGIMLYEMLTGEQPYKGEQPMQIAFQHATESVPRPSIRNPSIPEPLDELVLWATEKTPDERPRDAKEMLDRLRQIERELGISPLTTPPVATSANTKSFSDSVDITKVLPGTLASTAPTMTVERREDNASRLRRRARRRRSRGGWLLALVLLLAVLAGGAGWWFGSGPGALIAVPPLAGLSSFEEAEDVLAEVGLRAAEEGEHTREVAEGVVIRSDPEEGERLEANELVTVFVSLGPQLHTVEALRGRDAAEVRAQLESLGVTVDDDESIFSDQTARDAVARATIHPASGADSYRCNDGCELYDGDSATLLVSVGPVPDVSGLSVPDATRVLEQSGLDVDDELTRRHHESVAADRVIGIADRSSEGNWRPGETVRLIVSDGPAPIEIPDLSDGSVRNAMDTLTGLGFRPTTLVPEFFWDIFSVQRTDPPAGEWRVRGTEVRVIAVG